MSKELEEKGMKKLAQVDLLLPLSTDLKGSISEVTRDGRTEDLLSLLVREDQELIVGVENLH